MLPLSIVKPSPVTTTHRYISWIGWLSPEWYESVDTRRIKESPAFSVWGRTFPGRHGMSVTSGNVEKIYQLMHEARRKTNNNVLKRFEGRYSAKATVFVERKELHSSQRQCTITELYSLVNFLPNAPWYCFSSAPALKWWRKTQTRMTVRLRSSISSHLVQSHYASVLPREPWVIIFSSRPESTNAW